MIFFVPSVKTVQISNANLKYKSQKQISNTNLKCKSQMQVQNANLKCNDQIRRIPGNVGKQEWMGGSEDVQYTIRLGTCLTECLSCPLCRDVSNLKCRTKFEEYLESKDRQYCRKECSNYVPCQPLACALGEIINYGIITCRLLSAAD